MSSIARIYKFLGIESDGSDAPSSLPLVIGVALTAAALLLGLVFAREQIGLVALALGLIFVVGATTARLRRRAR